MSKLTTVLNTAAHAAAILIALSGFVQAQDSPQPRSYNPPTVRAQGSATVTANPDQVRIEIGVISEGATAQTAAADNSRQFAAALTELKKVMGDRADIQTVSYNLNPNYKYPKEGGKPTIVGYTAVNVVRAVSNDVSLAGKVIDAVTRNGANTVRGIQFALKDEQAVRAKALTEATRQARANAEAMAAGAGQRIRQVLRIEDAAQGSPQPIREMAMMRGAMMADAAVPTQVESGVIRVEATVFLTAELNP